MRTGKIPTARRQEESVLAAAAAVGAAGVGRFAHGTTVATNALLERKGARMAFVSTAGFEHLLHLRRQNRAELYRLCAEHPEPLVPLERCFGVRERIGPDGVIAPLDLDSLPAFEAEAVAVCLLFSFRDRDHERAVAEELGRRLPEARIVASHEVSPEFREYERASTTAIDAYLGPVVAGYLGALGERVAGAGLPEPLVMRSSGGVASLDEAAALAGGIELDREAAARAFGGIDPAAALEVVNAEMLRTLRVVSVERGHDPREFALVAFGGAGPLHACALADELEIGTVLVPAAAGVLSALGLVASDERRDRVVPYMRPLAEVTDLPVEGEADLRYAGQSFELTVAIQDDLAEVFHRAHEERYGYAERGRELELVAVRTAETKPGPSFDLPPGEPLHVEGPTTVELDGATCYVAPGRVGDREG